MSSDDQSEEFTVDPNDLEVFDEVLDPNYQPSDEEVIRYAEYLGFDIENYEELLPLAYTGLTTPLPNNYKRVGIKGRDEVLYINLDDNTLMDVSPIDELVIEKYNENVEIIQRERQRQQLQKGKNKKQQQAPKQPIPKSLPPLKGKTDGNDLRKSKEEQILNSNTNTNENKVSEDKPKKSKGKKKEQEKDKDKEKALIEKENEINQNKMLGQYHINESKSESRNKQHVEVISFQDDDKVDKIKNQDDEENRPSNLSKDNSFNNDSPDIITNVLDIRKYKKNKQNNEKLKNKEKDSKEDSSIKEIREKSVYRDSKESKENKEKNTNINKYDERLSTDDIILVEKEKENDNNEANNNNNNYNKPQVMKIDEKQFNKAIKNTNLYNDNIVIVKSDDSYKTERIKELAIKKQNYQNEKLQQLKNFESFLKQQFDQDENKYKQNKNKIKGRLQETYEDMYKQKADELDNNYNNDISNFEIDKNNEMIQIIEKVQEEKIKLTKHDKDITEETNKLIKKCDDLKKEISTADAEAKRKTEDSARSRDGKPYLDGEAKDNELIEGKELKSFMNLTKDKYEIDLKNLENKYDILEAEYSKAEADKFDKDIEKMNKVYKSNSKLQGSALESSCKKLIKDYELALEEEFNLKHKQLPLEFEKKYVKNSINQLREELEIEKKEKIQMFNREIKILEEEYMLDISKLRNESSTRNLNSNKNISSLDSYNEEFMKNYETLKNQILNEIDDITKTIMAECISNPRSRNNISDSNAEDFIFKQVDIKLFKFQKFNGKYDNNESNYKNNIFLFEYVSVVGLELIRSLKNFSFNKFNNELLSIPETSDFDDFETMKSQPNKSSNINIERKNHEFFNKLLFKFEKLYQEYRSKQQMEASKLLYPFLDEFRKMQQMSMNASKDIV